jgi:FHA domain
MSADRQRTQAGVRLHAIVAPGPDEHWLFPAGMAAIRIGRARENDLVLTDPSVSRTHARIMVAGEQCRIEDLESSLGVYVNGEKISAPTLLANGDYLGIGGVLLRFEADTPTSEADHAGIAAVLSMADSADPERATHQVPLSAAAHAIGRSARCDVVVDDLELAAVEAILTIAPDAWRIVPLFGAVGTSVGGNMLTGPMVLDDSRRVRIGKHELRLRKPPPVRRAEDGAAARDTSPKATLPAAPTIAVHTEAGAAVAEPEFALMCLSAGRRGMRYPLRHPVVTLGSAAECEMQISSLPARALSLTQTQSRYRVEVLDPAASVRLSGARKPPCELRKGDLIEVGGLVFRLIRRREPFTSFYDPAEFNTTGAALASRVAWQKLWTRWRGK